MKSPDNKKQWIVDEEAAAVVKRIFDLCVAGKGPMQIAKILTADKVLTVKAYYAKRDGKTMPDNFIGGITSQYREFWNVPNILAVRSTSRPIPNPTS